MEQGLFVFRYGDAVVEFLHVDNLVQAHILAAEALRPHRDTGTSAVSMQFFLISKQFAEKKRTGEI